MFGRMATRIKGDRGRFLCHLKFKVTQEPSPVTHLRLIYSALSSISFLILLLNSSRGMAPRSPCLR